MVRLLRMIKAFQIFNVLIPVIKRGILKRRGYIRESDIFNPLKLLKLQ